MQQTALQKSPRTQKGFTLLELLIAMSVSAVISVLAYQAIASMVATEQKVAQHQQATQTLQRVIWWMEQDLIQMTPRAINDGLNGVLPALQYREDIGLELSRLAGFMTPNARNGLLRVGYRLENNTLYRVTWPVVDRSAGTQPTEVVILQNIERIRWRFLDQSNQWQLSWPLTIGSGTDGQFAEQRLPKAVEVELWFTDGERIQRLFRGTDGVIAEFSAPTLNANAGAQP